MSRVILTLVLAIVVARAQAYQAYKDLLLPEARHVSSVVTDWEGKPIAGARIDHSDLRRRAVETDSQGKFELDTRAAALVVRKAGFRSMFFRTTESIPSRMVLEAATQGFPVCGSKGPYMGIAGWGASFQFLETPGVRESVQDRDIDYGMRFYSVRTKSGKRSIRHGAGPMWGAGWPWDPDVWQSVTYEEVSYAEGPTIIIDARGVLPNGEHWRSLGKFGESATYSGVDSETSDILNRVLDSACVKAASR
jgi:hypothetical protein